ncbi:substrate-binding periplasmic protein [Alteromonas halophila]|uniref:Solute-binding protein family 3/N-terminal domain-containing protein n=1 Tax=Alteromonas halophila TaxID=516698 RepID=A0A918MYR8_9ALTE|nr:transporter substrate-binding domain-containing protein [Alteromonas halophila]GGW89267.1 hypothetical protein GCM10007391_24360 [Alteromonas halophila]
MLRPLFLLLLLVSATANAGDCDTPLVVAYNGDWGPYFYSYGHEQYDGTDYELLRDVANAMGCDLAVLPMNEVRSSIELEKGSYDVSLGATYTKERQQSFHFSTPYRDEQIGLVISAEAGHTPETTLADILSKGGKVGINMSGYFGSTVALLKEQYPSQFIHEFSLTKRVSLLSQKTVDAIVDDRLALCLELRNVPSFSAMQERQSSSQAMILSNEILHHDAIHFMFSKHTTAAAFVTRFNKHLSQQLQHQASAPVCPWDAS